MNIAQDHPKICDEIRELSSGCNGAVRLAQMYEMGTILRYGNTEQKQRYLQDIAAGKKCLQAVSVTAPISKTDTGTKWTSARADEAVFRLGNSGIAFAVVSSMRALSNHGVTKRMSADTPAALASYLQSAARFRGAPRTCGSVRRLDVSNSDQTIGHKRDG
ncbi:MAG: acyl-CoA dehydrogenase family protein [Rhizobiaceae bacterium]|nr:acyl-CoA dehydrogenase family protein [Rhizobiaceae bacterium]